MRRRSVRPRFQVIPSTGPQETVMTRQPCEQFAREDRGTNGVHGSMKYEYLLVLGGVLTGQLSLGHSHQMTGMGQACHVVGAGRNLPSRGGVAGRTSGHLGAEDSRATSLVAVGMQNKGRRGEDTLGSTQRLMDL